MTNMLSCYDILSNKVIVCSSFRLLYTILKRIFEILYIMNELSIINTFCHIVVLPFLLANALITELIQQVFIWYFSQFIFH